MEDLGYGIGGFGLLVILISIIIFFITFRSRRKRRDQDDDTPIEIPPFVNSMPGVIHGDNRIFTLAELKRSEEGKYSWDDTGCVYEINPDGSVTIVGHFDPTELLIDPKQQLYNNLIDDGFFDMLPKLWGVYDPRHDEISHSKFWLSYNNTISYINILSGSIDDVRTAGLSVYNADYDIDPLLSVILDCTVETTIILLPSNEQEFILSLGIQSCIRRHFGKQIIVRISSPCVMGAFGVAIKNGAEDISNISFAYDDGDNYSCCNLFVDKGVCEVRSILSSSVILPLALNETLLLIAKGCMTQSLILAWEVKDYLLLDMIQCPISLLLKEDDHVVKIYELYKQPLIIPTIKTQNDVVIRSNQVLSLVIGTNEIVSNIIQECDSDNGTFDISAETDANMNIELIISKDNNKYKINIGEFIG